MSPCRNNNLLVLVITHNDKQSNSQHLFFTQSILEYFSPITYSTDQVMCNAANIQATCWWFCVMAGFKNLGMMCYANAIFHCLGNAQENHNLLQQHFNMHTIPGNE